MPAKQTTTSEYPKRLWVAGPRPYAPQETIVINDKWKTVKFTDGVAEVANAEEEAIVRRALSMRRINVYEEDLPDKEESLYVPQSKWFTRSLKAQREHMHNLPITAQG